MNIISLSLFGDGEIYNRGAVENARLAPLIYPGWGVRVYHDARITVKAELVALGVELVAMPISPGAKAMCWRFLPAADGSIDRVIVRDADSRLNVREAAAVEEWIKSGKRFHLMRDHEHHKCYPIFGGMWGCAGGALPDIEAWIEAWPRYRNRMDDMLMLNQRAWPLMEGNVCHHTSVVNQWGGKPFPNHPRFDGFVGERVAP